MNPGNDLVMKATASRYEYSGAMFDFVKKVEVNSLHQEVGGGLKNRIRFRDNYEF